MFGGIIRIVMVRSIIFDWKRTLYDPDNKVLTEGALSLLEFINSKSIPMVLIGKGGEDMQREVERLGVGQHFRQIVFAQGDKNQAVFRSFISKDGPERTLFIGDRVKSELEIGNKLGATTIWVKQGKFALEKPLNKDQMPDYTVSSLTECLKLISGLD